MMKNLFYSLLLIAVPFILQAQSYGFYTTEAAHQYNLYIDNNYEGGTGYAARIYNTKSNANTQYGLYSTVWNDGSGLAYSVYGYCNSLGTANAYAGYFQGSYGSGVPTGYGVYASCSGAANNYAGYFDGKVETTGDVGIGIDPVLDLHVKQTEANRAMRTEHETDTDYWTTGIGTSTKNYRWEFNGLGKANIVSSDGSYATISDVRLKTDFEPIKNVLERVMLLKPLKYHYIDATSDAMPKSVGFIAQDVEKLFPEAVKDFDGGYKSLAYDYFAVYAIAAIQELNNKVQENEELTQKIETLEQRLAALENALMGQSLQSKDEASPQIQNILDDSKARLEQNTPNPFYNKTIIQYFLPENSRDAQIQISNVEGKIVKTFPLSTSGFGTITVNGGELAAGTYFYTLNIANATIATKQMILTK